MTVIPLGATSHDRPRFAGRGHGALFNQFTSALLTQILLSFLLVRLAPEVARSCALVRWKALDELEHRKVLIYP